MQKSRNILFFIAPILFLFALVSLIFLFGQTGFSFPQWKKVSIFSPQKYQVQLSLENKNPNDLVLSQYFSSHPDNFWITNSPSPDIVIDNTKKDDNSIELYSEPLVVVTNRQIFLDDISLDQLATISEKIEVDGYIFSQLVFAQKYSDSIKNYFPNLNQQNIGLLSDNQSTIDYLQENPQAIGLIPLSQLTIEVHPLSLNKISVFDQPKIYPLRLSTYIFGTDQSLQKDIVKELQDQFSETSITRLLVVGDIMMGRYVGVKIARSGNPNHSFEYTANYLSSFDITVAQLEAPLSGNVPLTSEGMILVAQPETVTGLTNAGIDLVFNSSNHFGDAWSDGMKENFQILKQNNIQYSGAGRNISEAFSPQFIEKNNQKIGFLGFVSIMPDSYGASLDQPGTAWIDLNSETDLSRVQTIIHDTKNKCDLLFVNFHWGTEYTPDPTPAQIKFAHAAIDAGADLIIGTHPHVVQADEVYQGKYIIYSLGNFIMDQMWSQETTEGVLLPVEIVNGKIISTDLVPTQIIDYSQVKIIDKKLGRNILDRIVLASQKIS